MGCLPTCTTQRPILTQELNQIHWSNRFVKNVKLIFWEFYNQNSGLIF